LQKFNQIQLNKKIIKLKII